MANQTTNGQSPNGLMLEEIHDLSDMLTELTMTFLVIPDLPGEKREEAHLCYLRLKELLKAEEDAIFNEAKKEAA